MSEIVFKVDGWWTKEYTVVIERSLYRVGLETGLVKVMWPLLWIDM